MNTDRIAAGIANLNMNKDNLFTKRDFLKTLIGIGAVEAGNLFLRACGTTPDSITGLPTQNLATEVVEATPIPLPKVEPLVLNDIDVLFKGKEDEFANLGVLKEDVKGGYFEGSFLFYFKDKDGFDYFLLNRGDTSEPKNTFEPLDFGVDVDGHFYLGPKTNVGKDANLILRYFAWNPNVTDQDGNMIVSYQSDGSTNTELKFALPKSNEIYGAMKVQARLVEPESPTASYEKMEAEYIATLTPEQKALYEQYGSKDRTSEGLVRRFLEHDGLKTYLAYVDVNPDSKDLNEVVAVWNPEQKKSNPAKLIGTNVLILNETSGDKIEFTGPQAEATLEKYFKYVRANMIALNQGVNLPNELDDALADPRTIEYLANGAQVNLRAIRSESYSPRKYNVSAQTISISESTSIVFKTVKEPDPNMFFITKGPDIYMGWSIDQSAGGPLTINYSSNGLDTIQGSNSSMLLAKRISKVMHSLFFRASNDGSSDTITNTTIFNGGDLSTKPLIIYTK
jgi:hypothetical protein